MQIRKAKPGDLPGIIDLLKASLGENLIPKSETLWKWKHENNPFGKSPVLIATDGNITCGVRAFLRWEFQRKGEIIKACRAVDTAVLPSYQGKGLFKKLTLRLLDELKEDGFGLIYNTPNTQSLPGYLKMGWKKKGKLPLKIQINPRFRKVNEKNLQSDWNKISKFISTIESSSATNVEEITTHLIPGYIEWRYVNCPLVPYCYISDEATYLLVYRTKESGLGKELRITDLYLLPGFGKLEAQQLNQRLKQVQLSESARFTSFSGLAFRKSHPLKLGILPVVPVGPEITLRKAEIQESPESLPWAWSLGDLEIF